MFEYQTVIDVPTCQWVVPHCNYGAHLSGLSLASGGAWLECFEKMLDYQTVIHVPVVPHCIYGTHLSGLSLANGGAYLD